MSICVNLSSKEFKDCCKRLNVSAASLEPIIHEYINIKGNESSFPSDDYINDIINGKSSTVLTDEQIILYEKKYSQPKAFKNADEANAYREELLQFFPKESIGFKETLSGVYEVKIANLISENTLKEIQSIKEKAIADGTFMKAPNGKPTNLTERQWLHVRTKAFKRWFGDWESQVLLDNVNLFNLTNGFYGKGDNKKDGFIIKDGNLILTPKIYGSGEYTQTRYTHHFTAIHPVIGTHEDWDSLNIILITPYKDIRDAVGNEALNVEPMDIYFGSTKNIEIPVKNIKVIVASEEIKNRLINKGFLSENIEVDSVWGNLIKKQSELDRNDILDEDEWNRNHKAIEDRRRELTAKYSISKEEYDRIIKNRGYSSVLEDSDYSKTPYTHTDSWLHRGEIQSTYGTYGLDKLADDIRRGKANMHEIIFGYEIIATTKYKDSKEDVKTIIDAYNNLKNYSSVSKIVDENGEPLVVYHGGASGITEFRTSTENSSNTGYGFYTDKQTGEKIPVDSARAMFFSSNKHVAKSYAQLYALQYFRELRVKTQSAISTFYEGKASIEKDVFKTIDEFYDFLTIVSEFNPRFKKLRDYLKDIKSRGQRIKPNEVEEARKLFIELRSNLDKYTKDWNLNSSSWDNALEEGTNIINEYSSKEGIQRLKRGEIPKHIKKEWELYNKIQNHRKKHGLPELGNYQEVIIWLSSSTNINDSDYRLIYSGKELILDDTSGQREIPISQLSNEQIEEFFNKAKAANTKSIEDRKKINADIEEKYSKISDTYGVFLNIRNPLIHDYEGTHMGQGYKQSPKNSFGYVAARQVNKAIKEGHDGVVYENLYDPYLANNYGVFDPNQIKSADSNIGTYSEDTNIYLNTSVNPYSTPSKKKKFLVLSKKTSESFTNWISKAHGKYPKEFQDANRPYIYRKSNNHKNSKKYDIIDSSTGEIIAQNVVLYTQEEYQKLLEVKKKFEPEYKKYSEKRSLAYKKGLMMPSKSLFKRMAKQYLLEAIYASDDISEHVINTDIIDEFINKFDDSFWEHVVTFLLEPSFFIEIGEDGTKRRAKYGHGVMGLATSDLEVFHERFAFNDTIPKHGLLQTLEERLSTKIIGKKVKIYTEEGLVGVTISRDLDYKTLKQALKVFISQEFPITEEESIKAFANATNQTVEEVKQELNKLRDEGDIASSQYREYIRTFNPKLQEVSKIQKEYNIKYSEYLKEKGINIPKNLVHIIFNRDSYAGEDTPLVRLATILHEPYHALSILLRGSEEHNAVIEALEAFITTPDGKKIYEAYISRNKEYNYDTIKEEFLADLFSLLLMPKELRSDYSLLENKEGFLGPELAKLIDRVLAKPETLKLLTSKKEIIIEEVSETYTEEEKIILPLLQRIYNAIVKWLSKYSKLVKESVKLFEDTKLVEKTRITKVEKTVNQNYEIEVFDEDLQSFKDALSTLSSAMEILMGREVPSTGEKPLTSTNYMISTDRGIISEQEVDFITESFVPSEKAKEYGLTESKLTSALQELNEIESSYGESQDKEITVPYSKYKEAVGEESSAMVRAIVELLKEKDPTIYNESTKEITIKSEYYFRLASHFNKHKEFWEFVFGEDDNGILNLDLDYRFSEYYEVGSLESILNALQESGDILYRYKDSRQGELFNEKGLTQKELDAIKQREEEKQRELDLILQDTLQLNEQIKELSKSDLITMSEVKQLSFDIAYAISDLITQWQDNPEKFFENFPSKRTDNSVLDIAKIQSMSRAELVQFIGVKNLLDTVKELIFGAFPEGVNEDKVMLLYDNFDALIRFGADAFGSVEDFQLRYSEVGFVIEDVKTDEETDALSNEEQAVTEELGDKQEHWQIDTRTIDNFLSMSQIVKRELVRCYQLDSNNNPKTNEFGINQRVNPREATSCILRWIQGSLTLADMITKLENKSIANPWIKPIISKLKDSSGKYTDFQSQFFGVFCKHFQEYYIVKEFKEGDKKVYKIMPINVNPALREVMGSIDVLYKMQKHPMFNSNGIIESQFRQLEKAVNKLKELQKQGFNSLDLEQISKGIAYCSELLGYHITSEDVKLFLTEESFNGMIEDLSYIVFNLSKNLGKQDYDPFTFNKKSNGIRGNLSSFLKPLTDILEDTALSSFFDSGKMYQSYIIPSYLTKLMKKLQHADDAEFKKFMQEEYGKYEWFRDQSMSIDEPSSWKNHWLRQLYTMSAEDRKKNFGHKVQLSFLGHNYMRNMSGPEYVLSILTEYFSKEGDSKEASTTAWYKVPMMSNKPSLEFIKFTRHRGIGYETTLLDGFEAIFSQELARIITVKLRAYNEKDDKHIGGFDANGNRFHFLNFLNPYLKEGSGTELGILLNRAIEGEQLSEEDSTKLSDLVRQEIAFYMNERVNTIIEGYKSSGIFEAAKKIDGIGNTDEEIESALREFIWNDTFAAMNILQMTITDIAYYKNAEDLQKRLAQIHAPGIRPNVAATDYQGNPVSDGKLRAIFLADYTGKDVIQNIIENLEVVFDRKISQAKTDAERDYWERTKESIIKTFREDINVADAQAYNCPTSYRKKALMFGKWNKKFEETYQKLRKGEYNASDLEIAFQPLKPFVYTNTEKQVGVEGAPLQTIKVGMQFKNAEYALIMADALLQGEDTGKPNLLRALFEVMKASADKNPTKGIDTFMFASAVKAGLHGRINLSKFVEKGDAKGYIEELIYGDGADGYNETYVHTFPAEDYSIQQEYSRHFLDHSQAHGSQERYIIPSDLEYVDADGNPVLYEFEDNGKHRKLTADDFRKEYEDTIAENIENSIETLSEELGLNNSDIKTRNIALSKILQKEILSSPRYGMDLYFACSVDKDGNFNIPLGDPIQSKRIEQLINSIVKNRINKQKIAGGPVVQVSNFGMSRRLNIKFKDKQGNILPTLTEWLDENPGKTAEDFKQEIEKKQAGIAYYECYAPAYMQEMFEDFMDENGNIDVEALQELNPELLDMIGYRIPTEDKYSIAPLRIVGFLPKEAGEALVLPYEITVIAGLDYDWDKFYLMRKEFIIKMNKIKDIKASLINHFGTKRIKEIQEFIDKALNPETRREAYIEYPDIAKQFRRVAFSIEKPTKGKAYRNNKIINMSLAVLTHSTTADKILNPGGFEPQKRMGYLVSAYKILTEERLKQLQIENPEITTLSKEDLDAIWNSLYNMSTSSLKDICMTEKNLCFIDVNTQFYEQNNAAGSILGMFAVQKIAHAVLENNKLYLDINAALKLGEEGSFAYMGKVFRGLMEFDGTKNFNGEYVGKVLGSLVASAADAVKDPVLNLMNINSTTANVLTTMIRFGIPFEDAALLLSQKVITDCLKEFNVKNLSGFITFNTIIEEKIKQLKEEHNIADDNEINTEDLTKEELVRGLVSSDVNVQYKTLLAFSRFMTLSKELKGPTYATRFNSISNAVGPLIIDNLIMENKLDTFSENIVKVVTDKNGNEQTISISMEDILNEHPILKCFTKTLVIANNIFGDHMPLLSKSFKSVISSLPEELANKIYGDRKLLSKLADFYLSYLLVNSGCINTKSSKGLNYYINDFPKEFFDSKIKEKYPNNPFIQAIRIATTKDSAGKERFVLKLETTGMDTLDKEKLSGGWEDLFKTDFNLAMKLFKYCFYKGGIGFNPKTFMHLLPTNVKELIPDYIKSFDKNNIVNIPEIVVDQFVRNNWNNSKISPLIKTDKNIIKPKDKNYFVVDSKDISKFKGVKYCRVKVGKQEKLFKVISSSDYGKNSIFLEEIIPLGNNGEYLEISIDNIKTSMDNPIESSDYNNDTSMPESPNNADDESNTTVSEESRYLDLLLRVFPKGQPTIDAFRKRPMSDKQKAKENYRKWFENKFKELGIEFNMEEFDKLYETFCG